MMPSRSHDKFLYLTRRHPAMSSTAHRQANGISRARLKKRPTEGLWIAKESPLVMKGSIPGFNFSPSSTTAPDRDDDDDQWQCF
ncbi:uncharacterized protein ARMOST_10455 [Armillaria ostoyae]|uniref:Uncharacterized protein n=1 Tax=Armillaria ostoyae TaxID=47428 RepID=A0A284REC3_ARMOS|nr:uncharacterized protein ARMOST_10455 [Armillaria ostoyae]